MNWFRFLASKKGKIVLSAQNALIISAGVGIMGTTLMHNLTPPSVQEELAVRSLSAVSNAYNYGGMRRNGREGLTSINVKDGLNQVATAEERARMEDSRTGGGNFGLDAADNVGNSLAFSAGQAAGMSDTEGLGMGRNAVVMNETPITGSPAEAARFNPGAIAGQTGRSDAPTGTRQLTSASPTRAGGSNINASYGGASAGGNSVAGSRPTNGGKEGYKFSGAMPDGSDPLSLGNGNRQIPSTFMAGGRNATSQRGRQTVNQRDDLKYIAKRSADAARDVNRSSNEASRAFLDNRYNSGGMTIDSTVDNSGGETVSDDYSNPVSRAIRGISNWSKENVQPTVNTQDNDLKNLRNWLMGLIGAAIAGIVLAAGLLSLSGWYRYFGYVALAGVAFMIYKVWEKAEAYRETWQTNTFPNICEVLCGLALAGVVFTALKPQMVWEWIGSTWKNGLKMAFHSLGMPMVTTIVQDSMNKDK